MTRLAIISAMGFSGAASAFADEGAHLHPHGFEAGWGVLAVGLTVAVTGLWVAARRG